VLLVILTLWPSITAGAAYLSDPKDLGSLSQGQSVTRTGSKGTETVKFHAYWTVIVNGQTAGEDLVVTESGKTAGNTNYIARSQAPQWVNAFNGSWSHAQANVPWATLSANGKTSSRVHIRDLAKASGAYVEKYDTKQKKVWVVTTPWPSGNIPTLRGVVAGQPQTFRVDAYASTAAQRGIEKYTFSIGGTPIKEGSSTSNYTSFSVTHTFPSAGTYTMRLEVTDMVGRTTPITKTVTVAAAPQPPPPPPPPPLQGQPIADFDIPQIGEVGQSIQVVNKSKASDGCWLVNSQWTVNPRTYAGSLGMTGGTLVFNQPGTYTVKLQVWDNQNNTSTATKSISIMESGPPPPPPTPPQPENIPPMARFDIVSQSSPGVSVPVKNRSYDPDGQIVAVDWDVSPGANANLGDTGGSIVFNQPRAYTVTLTVEDDQGDSDTAQKTIRITNESPVARISAPATVFQGDEAEITSDSYDPDGEIAGYAWSVTPAGMVGTLTGEGGSVYFDEPGTYTVSLTVEDRFGLTDTATKTVEVKPAVPTAFFRWTGTPKQNRKMVFDSSESYGSSRYPVDFSQNQWEFIPPAGVSQNAVKIVSSPDMKTRQVLFKEPGDYRVRLVVKNTKGTPSPVYEQVVTVYPDDQPVADFYTISTVTRDPANANKAAIALMDRSYSPDADVITKRVWQYRYDSDNDDSFADESWVALDSSNNPTPMLYATQVGKYEFSLAVEESFGQETIPEFITAADKRVADTTTRPLSARSVEVINVQPVVNFDVIKKKKADILFVTGKLDNRDAKYASFQNNLAGFRNTLSANSIDAEIIQADAVGNMEVVSQQDSNYLYYYIGGTVEPRYVVRVKKSGNDMGGMVIYRREASTGSLVEILNLGTYDIDLRKSNGGRVSGHNFSIGSSFISGGAIQTHFSCGHMNIYRTVTVASDGTITISYSGSSGYYSYQDWTYSGGELRVSSGNRTVKIDNGSRFQTWGPAWGNYTYQFKLNYAPKLKDVATILAENSVSFREGARPYVVYFGDNPFDDFNDGSTLASFQQQVVSRGGRVIGLGSTQNQAQLQTLISQADAGTFLLNNTNMTSPMQSAAGWIVQDMATAGGILEQYVLVGDEVVYQTYYEDTENDPKYAERWIYQHDPYWFKNSLGAASYDGQYLPAPVTRFDKVGKFDVEFQARDNPKPDNRFDSYRQWSAMPQDRLTLYVHRRPMALYSLQLTPSGGVYNVSLQDQSYDPDHQGEAGNGIRAREWRWKEATATAWNSGIPSTLPAGKTYLFSLRVQDVDGPGGVGEWSLPNVRTASTSSLNMAPVAQFSVSPNPLPLGKSLIYNDISYDPNGDPIVQRNWRMAKLPNGSWMNYGGTPPNNFSSLGVGDYKIELTVKDSQGAWSDPFYQTVTVIPDNNKPFARFTVSPNPLPLDVPVTYSDTSWDPDGDPIVAREWQYQKNSGAWVNGQPMDFTALGTGSYNIRLRVKDQPALSQMTPLWSDWYIQALSVIAGNQKPVAQFAVTPNPAITDEPVTYTDTSYDPEGKGIAERVWQVTDTAGRVLGEYHNQLPPRVFANTGWGDGGAGTYRIGLRVRDNSPNGISPALWSDWTWQTLTVVMPLSGSGEISPNPALSGFRVHITVQTSGYAEEVTVSFPQDSYFQGEEITLAPDKPVTNKENTWRGAYLTDVKTPDGPYNVTATVKRMSVAPQTIMVPLTLVIRGDIYDQIRVRIRDSR